MKKKLISALVCVVILLANILPAQALIDDPDGDTYADQETYEFWQRHEDELRKKYNISKIGLQAFHDGLLLVSCDGTDMYVNKDAQVVDLNQGRFGQMFEFSNGLAAVSVRGGLIGYIDTSGTLVIPAMFWLTNVDGCSNQVGKFNGTSVVVFGSYHYDDPNGTYDDDRVGFELNLQPWSEYFTRTDADIAHDIPSRGLDYAFFGRGGQMLGAPTKIHDAHEALVFLRGRTTNYLGMGTEQVLEEYTYETASPIVPWVEYTGPENVEISKPEIPPALLPATYGQSSYKSLGYTIVNNVGYLSIQVTNPGEATDTGDLFYVLYNKHTAHSRHGSADGFVPGDFMRQIHYEVGPGEAKILRVAVGETVDLGRDFTEAELAYGWHNNPEVETSRYILAQAENEFERDELITLFKRLHYFVEMPLDYQPDKAGVTILAAPGGFAREAQILNEKFAAFTAQF